MLTKSIILCEIALCLGALSLFAQEEKTLTQQQIQRQIQKLYNVNPNIPLLSPALVQNELNYISKNFASYKFPHSLAELLQTKSFPTHIALKNTAQKLKKFISNRELEEVTGYSLSWFNAIGNKLVALYPAVALINQARMQGSDQLYRQGIAEYQKFAKELEKVVANPQKISSKELSKLKAENSKKRKEAIQKQIQRLTQKRKNSR